MGEREGTRVHPRILAVRPVPDDARAGRAGKGARTNGMTLATDLLKQARSLCAASPRRPKQADLRRAVSTAYYSLFHALIAAAVGGMLPARSELRQLVA